MPSLSLQFFNFATKGLRAITIFMPNDDTISAECLTPILYVRDFDEAITYYTKKLLFRKLWDWGKPPGFGAVALGKVEIFCLGSSDRKAPGGFVG